MSRPFCLPAACRASRRSDARSVRAAWRDRASVLALAAALSLGALALAAGPAEAARGRIAGTETGGHGRIVLTLDAPLVPNVRNNAGIVVLSFPSAVDVDVEKLSQQLPSYVSVVRRDPDGTALRFALTRPYPVNLLVAGEKLFLDILPETWKGLPPGLPPEVVEELARRARDAEEKARLAGAQREREAVRDLGARVANAPTFSRLVLEPPAGVIVDARREGDRLDILVAAPLRLDATRLKPALPPSVLGLSTQGAEGRLRVSLDLAPGTRTRHFREEDNFVVDVLLPAGASEPLAGARGSAEAPQPPPAPPPPGTVTPPRTAAPSTPPRLDAGASRAAQPTAPAAAAPSPADDPSVRLLSEQERARPVVASAAVSGAGVRLHFPFRQPPPAAAFERNGVAWLVFETAENVTPPTLPSNAAAQQLTLDRVGNAVVVRIALKGRQLLHLAPDGPGWVAALGAEPERPSAALALARNVDADGRTVLTVPMRDLGGVHWLADPDAGDRVAVVPARAPSRRLVRAQDFVEFAALATAHGLAVVPMADDLKVLAGVDEVTIARDAGLSITLPSIGVAASAAASPPAAGGRAGAGPSPGAVADAGAAAASGADALVEQAVAPAIEREWWTRERVGDVRRRERALVDRVASASRETRTDSRVDLVRHYVATGRPHEARGLLRLAVAEDPDALRPPALALLAAVIDVQTNHLAEARRTLNSEALARDGEAAVWRAALDARSGRFPQALVAFRRAAALIDAYPDEIQAVLRPLAAEAAIEAREFGVAARHLDALERLPPEIRPRDTVALARARLAEAQRNFDEALALYEELARAGARPAAARAQVLGTTLGLKTGKLTRDDAIGRLEGVSWTWRGDEVEAETLALLGRLYADAERWRDAFAAARKANRLYPDNESARALYDATAERFEDLFLDGRDAKVGRVDALALFYDFKEFTPVGRRGDAMIRRLADRLVELDLLEPAAELLNHQIQNRLTGAARASVATRLAVVELMNRRPTQALAALKATRLSDLPPEIRRARSLLEARSLSDLSRTDLAIEVLAGETGPDVERLRADVYWNGARWREAGETYERILGDLWRADATMTERDRSDAMRAGIAHALADDKLALERLKSKFSRKMADSPDARLFALVTAPEGARRTEFRQAARAISRGDTFAEFLSEYRRRYPETPPPRGAREEAEPAAAPAPAPAAARREASRPAPPPG